MDVLASINRNESLTAPVENCTVMTVGFPFALHTTCSVIWRSCMFIVCRVLSDQLQFCRYEDKDNIYNHAVRFVVISIVL